ncbi:MAG: glycoside hydrolase [Ignavibacteriae bacterium]|nr:glycoside hydrolase [Ignavibacteriota bacterium]NOG98454.1 glycoside hydrolase [Ignavibacteriota bacterium]
MKIDLKYCTLLLIGIACIFVSSITYADDYSRVLNLEGNWKFTIGDDVEWSDPNYNDSNWEEIYVPSSWEDQGFHGYNGYGWYRLKFKMPKNFSSKSIVLVLGFVDDVDEVFLNGELIGFTGSFPPEYETAYNAYRKYPIPLDALNLEGENQLAVRIYDSQLAGGIINGDIGIYAPKQKFNIMHNLEGLWKFNTGDEMKWKETDFDDSNWNDISVPALWETQGFKKYNGVAWYRKTFTLPQELENKKLVLLLGKIDDIDECYLNGTLIGNTGIIAEDPEQSRFGQEWSQLRGYYIPSHLLTSGDNTIAVRVYDGYKDGGIYEGPIGLITQEDYVEYWKSKKRKKSFWEILFDN